MDNFQVSFERRFPLVTLILMGDWCSEGRNRKLKEISAKGKMAVTQRSASTRKTNFLA
jgi:hypothetical protein